MEYYARSANKNGEKETVIHHVCQVAHYAEENAGHFDKRMEGRLAGLFHDFGKMGHLFQEVLENNETKVNHEMAGAEIVRRIFGEEKSFKIQMVICAHHKGLDVSLPSSLQYYFDEDYKDKYGRKMSIKDTEEFVKDYQYFMKEIQSKVQAYKSDKYVCCKNFRIEEMLATRMLFSALVDADYTASAEHYDPDINEQSTGETLNPKLLLDRLYAIRDEIKSNSKANIEVDRLRDQVFLDCIEAARKQSGLFTLTAPTGMGKTLALLAFALKHAQVHNKRRIIIILPFLSIIEQNAKQYRNICNTLLEDHSQTEYDENSRLYADRWRADIIVTTSVKFFESLFNDRPSVCRRIHSISDSVIVFDEAQSLPYTLIGATIESMNALCIQYKCSVVFSTATQPAYEYRNDLVWNPIEIIQNSQALFQATKRVNISWYIQEKRSLNDLALQMMDSHSCCTIVNMKGHASELFHSLSRACQKESESLFHISTDMCIAHREDTMKEINRRLSAQQSCRLVSTQCIEAGVDLDFDRVYRALAPLDAIVQSAGRCNRNGRLTLGEVEVFVPEDERYPDIAYENAANIVKLLLREKEIDINNPEHMREYYKYLYQQFNQDKEELTNAINHLDYEKVSSEYKLIPNKGNTVIVPYIGRIVLFKEICEQIRAEGLSPSVMKKAQPITVTVFGNKIADIAEQLNFKSTRRGMKGGKSNWYILLDDSLYDEKTGLKITKSTSLDTII